jgi:hypothetical protein
MRGLNILISAHAPQALGQISLCPYRVRSAGRRATVCRWSRAYYHRLFLLTTESFGTNNPRPRDLAPARRVAYSAHTDGHSGGHDGLPVPPE